MLNYILSYLTLFVLFIVQTTLSIYIDIFGIAPNLVFVYILCYSMYNFPSRSAVLCAIAGILTDLYTQQFVGFNALAFMYIGLAMSNFASSLIKNNIWTSFLGVLLVSIVYHSALLIAGYVVPGHSGFIYPFARFAVPTAVYDAVLSLAMTFWARRLSEDKIRGF